MRAMKWALFNGLFAALLWAAVVYQVEGARNVVMVLIWFLIVLTPFMWTDDIQAAMRKTGRSVPVGIDVTFDIAVLVLLLWHGWMATGIAYLLHIWIGQGAWSNALRKSA